MGKIWKAIKAAFGVAMRTTSWVWERCNNTGCLVGRMVMAPFDALGGGGVAGPVEPEPSAEEIATQRAQAAELQRMEAIKQLAAQILGRDINPETVKRVSKNNAEWLDVMDRRALARILCAEPSKIAAHLKGNRLLDGVPRSDAETISMLRVDIEMRLRAARQKEAQSRRATEASLEKGRKLLERDPDNPYRPAHCV